MGPSWYGHMYCCDGIPGKNIKEIEVINSIGIKQVLKRNKKKIMKRNELQFTRFEESEKKERTEVYFDYIQSPLICHPLVDKFPTTNPYSELLTGRKFANYVEGFIYLGAAGGSYTCDFGVNNANNNYCDYTTSISATITNAASYSISNSKGNSFTVNNGSTSTVGMDVSIAKSISNNIEFRYQRAINKEINGSKTDDFSQCITDTTEENTTKSHAITDSTEDTDTVSNETSSSETYSKNTSTTETTGHDKTNSETNSSSTSHCHSTGEEDSDVTAVVRGTNKGGSSNTVKINQTHTDTSNSFQTVTSKSRQTNISNNYSHESSHNIRVSSTQEADVWAMKLSAQESYNYNFGNTHSNGTDTSNGDEDSHSHETGITTGILTGHEYGVTNELHFNKEKSVSHGKTFSTSTEDCNTTSKDVTVSTTDT